MILVSVGSTRNDFSRLLREVDTLAAAGLLGAAFAQIGFSTYEPQHCGHARFVPREDLHRRIQDAEFVICHAGTGTVDLCLGLRKKVVLVPRLAALNEHPDDHQVELGQYLAAANRVLLVNDIAELRERIAAVPGWTPSFKTGEPNHALLEAVNDFLARSLGAGSCGPPRR